MSKNTEELEGYEAEEGLPEKLSLLRWKLWRKAKQEPRFKFYALYDRVYRWDVIGTAYKLTRKQGGSPGIDGVSFESLEQDADGVLSLLKEIQKELKSKTYRPGAVARVYIPKADGSKRPLGIPTIKDRVVQMAVKLIIEPIFEADFKDSSFGFRPGRNAHQAMDAIQKNLREGRVQVYDADLSQYFDTIDHTKLMSYVERRVVDGGVLRLIRMWLQSRVVDKDGNETTPKKGTPQGGVISPLLANIYLHEMDTAFEEEKDSPRHFANARLVRYADDFVVLARFMGERITHWIRQKLEGDLAVCVNTKKTTVVRMREQGSALHFLGFTMRYDRDRYGRDMKYLNIIPSKKAEKKFREKIHRMTGSGYKLSLKTLIQDVNQVTRGWRNYFTYGYPRKSFKAMNWYIMNRIGNTLKHRSQRRQRPFMNGENVYTGLRRLGFVPLAVR